MLKQRINLSFKDKIDGDIASVTPTEFHAPNMPCPRDSASSDAEAEKSKNCWSGYHVRFRNPRNFQEFAIDQSFNRWGDMVDFFSQQERPYKLSQGSLKDLLYGTYKRKGMHSLSLNDLVTIEKIDRTKTTKVKQSELNEEADSINEMLSETILSPSC